MECLSFGSENDSETSKPERQNWFWSRDETRTKCFSWEIITGNFWSLSEVDFPRMTAVSDHVLVYEPLASIQVPPRPYSVVPSRLFTIISSNLFISPSLQWDPLVFAPFPRMHVASTIPRHAMHENLSLGGPAWPVISLMFWKCFLRGVLHWLYWQHFNANIYHLDLRSFSLRIKTSSMQKICRGSIRYLVEV